MKRLLGSSLIAATLLATVLISTAQADEIADFYKGKTITLNVPAGPGTGFSLFSKLLTEHMRRYVPGTPNIIANFRPGGGGITGILYMANVAPRDGSEISLVLAPTVLLALLRPDQARFDARQFTWIGTMFPRTGAVWLAANAPATTLQSAKLVDVVLGASGKGSETFQTPALMNVLLGTKFKITTGYRSGAEINLAIERGEVHGRQQNHGGWEAAGKGEWVRDGKVIPIVQTGPIEPALGNVPSFRDIVSPGEERQMVELHEISAYIGAGVFAPPGIPAARAAALRRAFGETMRDSALLKDAARAGILIKPGTSDELEDVIARAYQTPQSVRERVRNALELN